MRSRWPAGQFMAAAVLLVSAAAFMFVSIVRSAEAEREAQRIDDELLRLQTLSTSVHEFGQFASEYVATGSERAARSAREGRGEALAELAEVRRAAEGRPGWYEWVRELAPLVERRVALSDRQTAIRRERGAGPAIASLRSAEGDRLDDEIGRRLDALQEDALTLQQTLRVRSRHRRLVFLAAFVFIVVLSLGLLAGSFRTLRREISAHRDTADKLREVSSALVRAEQRERRRLAQILHDHLQQTLAAAAMHLNLISRRETDAELRESAVSAAAILKEAVQTTRALSYELCPPDIARSSLGRSLRWLGDQMRARHKLDVAVVVDDDPSELPDSIRDFCLGASRELLFNVVKHARTPNAKLAVSALDGKLRLEVSDEGAGFDPAGARALESGLGLADIKERAGLFGGQLEVHSRPKAGCRVVLMLPVAAG